MAASKSSPSQARLMIWSPPRSLSTTFARSMSARGDTKVFWEPYLACYNYGPERKVHWADDIPGLMNEKYTFSYVKELLEDSHPDSGVLFAKCMIEAIAWNFDVAPSGYKHSFLIRDPFKMFRSYEKLSNVVPIDFKATFKNIYHDLQAFYQHVITKLGQSAPPILDADDLLQHPDKVLPKYCDAMGIPYTPDMLHWESINDPGTLNWECVDIGAIAQYKYRSSLALSKAFTSSGFAGSANEKDHDTLYSEDVLECANHAMPVYKRLYKFRIKP